MHSALPKKFVLFTGVTSGIGHEVIQEFCRRFHNQYYIHLIICCRNIQRGEEIKSIVDLFENIESTLVKIDLSDIDSVLTGCHVIERKFPRIDGMYLNAGIMPVARMRWGYLFKGLFNGDIAKIFWNGEGLFQLHNDSGLKGLPTIFSTNVLGHFIMVQKLKENLENRKESEDKARIIWTSSMSSNKDFFNLRDLMCVNGDEPYSSSKYIVDAVGVAWNDHFHQNKVQSIVVDPGTVLTNLMTSFLPFWFLLIFVAPMFFVLRLINPSNNIFPSNASSAFLMAYTQPDPLPVNKLCSSTDFRRRNYVRTVTLDVNTKEAEEIYKRMEMISHQNTRHYKQD